MGLNRPSKNGYNTKCVLTSEIKEAAIKAYELNFPGEVLEGDVTKIATKDIEDFDFLLAGFPCQAFSVTGKQRGFADTRGTLFFEVERILRDKKPYDAVRQRIDSMMDRDMVQGLSFFKEGRQHIVELLSFRLGKGKTGTGFTSDLFVFLLGIRCSIKMFFQRTPGTLLAAIANIWGVESFGQLYFS